MLPRRHGIFRRGDGQHAPPLAITATFRQLRAARKYAVIDTFSAQPRVIRGAARRRYSRIIDDAERSATTP